MNRSHPQLQRNEGINTSTAWARITLRWIFEKLSNQQDAKGNVNNIAHWHLLELMKKENDNHQNNNAILIVNKPIIQNVKPSDYKNMAEKIKLENIIKEQNNQIISMSSELYNEIRKTVEPKTFAEFNNLNDGKYQVWNPTNNIYEFVECIVKFAIDYKGESDPYKFISGVTAIADAMNKFKTKITDVNNRETALLFHNLLSDVYSSLNSFQQLSTNPCDDNFVTALIAQTITDRGFVKFFNNKSNTYANKQNGQEHRETFIPTTLKELYEDFTKYSKESHANKKVDEVERSCVVCSQVMPTNAKVQKASNKRQASSLNDDSLEVDVDPPAAPVPNNPNKRTKNPKPKRTPTAPTGTPLPTSDKTSLLERDPVLAEKVNKLKQAKSENPEWNGVDKSKWLKNEYGFKCSKCKGTHLEFTHSDSYHDKLMKLKNKNMPTVNKKVTLAKGFKPTKQANADDKQFLDSNEWIQDYEEIVEQIIGDSGDQQSGGSGESEGE
jgi:hypothetical protein